MTDLCEAAHCSVVAALENWARWCRSWRDLLPDCPTNWELIDQMEYKNSFLTTDEKLEEVCRQIPVDELSALGVERIIVNCLDTPKQTAIRIHYVTMPERDRHEFALTLEQWDERRARLATRRGNWYFTPDTYKETVDRAINSIEGYL